MGNLLNGCFCYSYLHELPQADIFQSSYFHFGLSIVGAQN